MLIIRVRTLFPLLVRVHNTRMTDESSTPLRPRRIPRPPNPDCASGLTHATVPTQLKRKRDDDDDEVGDGDGRSAKRVKHVQQRIGDVKHEGRAADIWNEIDFEACLAADPNLTPEYVAGLPTGSHTHLHFRCMAHTTCNKHVWHTAIKARFLYGTGCPYCSKKAVCGCVRERVMPTEIKQKGKGQSIVAGVCKWILDEIDYEKTLELDPRLTRAVIERLPRHTPLKVWFRCRAHTTCDKHAWPAMIRDRLDPRHPTGCPFCAEGGSNTKSCGCVMDAPNKLRIAMPDIFATLNREATLKRWPELEVDNLTVSSTAVACWTCGVCEYEWVSQVGMRAHLRHACPECANRRTRSKGEETCEVALKSLGEAYERERRLPGLVDRKPLKLDYFLPPTTDRAACAIEWDGAQHFDISWTYFGVDRKEVQRRDRIKNRYCACNGIHLLRIDDTIPYTSIEAVIGRFLRDACAVTGTDTIHRFVGRRYPGLLASRAPPAPAPPLPPVHEPTEPAGPVVRCIARSRRSTPAPSPHGTDHAPIDLLTPE